MGRPAISIEVQQRFWANIRAGDVIDAAAAAVGVSKTVGWRWFREAGGVMPPPRLDRAERTLRLSFAEREEVACRRAAGQGVREIARTLDRAPSTISRELARGTRRPKTGYRATVAQALADARARRPKTALLCAQPRLEHSVAQQLRAKHSPEQISRRLPIAFPDDPKMRVSHETIYQSLYVQGRGALKSELAQCLRTGRALRKPRRRAGERRGRLAGMVSISQRPPEVEDRAVPGHWEGDLVMGRERASAIGTLVERTTRTIIIVPLKARDATAVRKAFEKEFKSIPTQMKKTMTYDNGTEMAGA